MQTGLTAIGIIILLATIIESNVEYFIGTWLQGDRLKWVALACGLAAAYGFNIQLLHLLLGISNAGITGVADMIVSGVVMARGGQYVHDLYTQYAKPAPAA